MSDPAASWLAARQRDDNDMECWVREIHLRACVRIGELVRELDTAEPGGATGGSTVPPEGRSKIAAINEAGLSGSAAYRYQDLAGGRDERAQAAGKAASENYYAQSRAKSEPPTMAGLRAAVREARGTGAADLDAAGRPVGQGMVEVEGRRVQGALRAERARVDFLEGRGKLCGDGPQEVRIAAASALRDRAIHLTRCNC